MDLLLKMMRRFPQLKKLHSEFYFNTADGPRSTIDFVSQEFGALPVPGFRSESHYIDIPRAGPGGARIKGHGRGVCAVCGGARAVGEEKTDLLCFAV